MSKSFLGLGKTLFKSSVATISSTGETVICLNERLSRKKNDGSWPKQALMAFQLNDIESVFENRDVKDPLEHEKALDQAFPLFSFLEKNKLTRYSRQFNPELGFISHHLAHASSAMMLSPFEESLIIVMDGAGSEYRHLSGLEKEFGDEEGMFEAISCYHQKRGELFPLKKQFQKFMKSKIHDHTWSNHVGLFYEKIAEFIFASKTAAGKVMGLASFGVPMEVSDYAEFLEGLDWEGSAYKKEDHKEWERNPHMELYQNLAATAQKEFERVYFNFLETIRGEYPLIKNIILTGGCALNCTANGKLLDRNWFERVYVSPFPGDESIGHGCAAYGYSRQNADKWRSVPFENQHSFFGLERKVLTKNEIIEIIPKSGYEVKDIGEDYFSIVQLLQKGEVICWFQGRSECGPRALGHRSILALPTRPHLKNYLNNHIKFRESFRPYGSSVLWEAASQYFEIDQDFENPFMSFAVKAKPEFGDMLKEVCHVDGTSRMQTVRKESNPRFHHLLKEVGKTCGHPILLNTSFNKMGEPIVETFEDAFSFLRDSAIHYLIYENFLVIRK